MDSQDFSYDINRIRFNDIVRRVKTDADGQLYQYEEFLNLLEKKIELARFNIRQNVSQAMDIFLQNFQPPLMPAVAYQAGLCLDSLQTRLSAEPWFQIIPHVKLFEDSNLFADLKINDSRFEDISRSLRNLEVSLRKPELDSEWDPSLVTVGHIVNLKEFYVHRMCDQTIRSWLHKVLNSTAFPKPKEVKISKMYSVHVINKNTWYRGLCKNICGYSHLAGKESEPLFEFFLVDIGATCEMIKISNVCELPDEIVEVEPMAIACCINQFPETHQVPELIQYFRQLTSLSPLCMQICSRDGQFQCVDLSQIPVKPSEEVVISIRGALLQLHHMRSHSSVISRRQITIRRGTCLLATVANFVPPDEIFIEIDDTEKNCEQYLALMLELDMEKNSDQQRIVPDKIGQAYATRFQNRWIRVLLEQVLPGGRVLVYAIDNGRRMVILASTLRQLHERYLQLPPRITICRLTQIIKDDQPCALPKAAELIRRSIVNSRVTIYVEGQQMKLNYSTNIVTAFQQELNLFMTLKLEDQEIQVDDFPSRYKPRPPVKMEEFNPPKRERRPSISEFFLSAPPDE